VNFVTQWKDRSEAPKLPKKAAPEPAADRREAQMNFLVPLYNMIVMALGNQDGEEDEDELILPGLNDSSDDEDAEAGSDNDDDDEKDPEADGYARL
jgi:hypothetical protein